MSYKAAGLDLWLQLAGAAALVAAEQQKGTAIERLAWLTSDDRLVNRLPSPALLPVHDADVTISANETRHGIIICRNFEVADGVTLTTGPLLVVATGNVRIGTGSTVTADGRGAVGVNHGGQATGGTGGAPAGGLQWAAATGRDATSAASSGILWALARALLDSSMVPAAADVIGGGSGGSGVGGTLGGSGIARGGGVTSGLPQAGRLSGAGGGAMMFLCGDFANYGTLTADGLNGDAAGGGGGGLIGVLATTLTRRGTAAAAGGAGGGGQEAGGTGYVQFYHPATGEPL